jgi:lipopolysaccharide export system protein LptA
MKTILAIALLSMASVTAWAEKADSLKQAVVNFDTMDIDDVSQTRVLSGNVVVTRGTLVLKSDKAVLKETPEGYMLVTLTAAPGKVASFRQKRDGGPALWIEGQAQRIEYDERGELVKLFSSAMVKQLEGNKVTDELDSEYISYDSRREVMVARNDASGESKPGKGRGTLILAPRSPAPAAAAPAPGKQ